MSTIHILFQNDPEWPIGMFFTSCFHPLEFIDSYIYDATISRYWVDKETCNPFISIIRTAFRQKKECIESFSTMKKLGPQDCKYNQTLYPTVVRRTLKILRSFLDEIERYRRATSFPYLLYCICTCIYIPDVALLFTQSLIVFIFYVLLSASSCLPSLFIKNPFRRPLIDSY